MQRRKILIGVCFIFLLTVTAFVWVKQQPVSDDPFISYVVDTKSKPLKLYWKDENGRIFQSIHGVKRWLAHKQQRLVFAMNAGMFTPDFSPVGLYIENGRILSPLDTTTGQGNFYLQPNGVFYITKDNTAAICNTTSFLSKDNVTFATQSGPMLVINDTIHPRFKKGSANKTIRNGVGILPDNKVVFAMSKDNISFYDFATYFKNKGCKNALYLDGFVSRTYLPEKNWTQTDGNLGVILGIAEGNR